MPRELNVVYTVCVGKPWQPTSTGNSQVCHLRSLHRVCRSVYLAFFNSYALWHFSSQGNVSSKLCTMAEYDLGCLFFHKVCSLGCLLGSIGRDLLVKVGRHRLISRGTSASVTVTVQGLSTWSMTLVCPFGPPLSSWTLLSISLISCWTMALCSCGSAVFHWLCSLFPFCLWMVFQRCPYASVLSLLFQQLGLLTTFCRFLSLILAWLISWSLESLSVTTSLVFETLNSSST